MKAPELHTEDESLLLIEPVIERDAPLSMKWLEGAAGRRTIQLMGVKESDIQPPKMGDETERISNFISKPDQLNWMISYRSNVVGSIWVDLIEKNSTPAPSLHIMIGDPDMRGKGIGHSSIKAVIEFLSRDGTKEIYSRHLANNIVAMNLLHGLGFRSQDKSYVDSDGLEWQNIKLEL